MRVYGPAGTAEIVSALIEGVYAKDIRFRAEGEPAVGGWKPVEVSETGAGLVCEGDDWKVYAEFVEHGQGLGIPDFDWTTLGYRLGGGREKPSPSAGIRSPARGWTRLARGADTLVLCCYLAAAEVTDAHTERLTRLSVSLIGPGGEDRRERGCEETRPHPFPREARASHARH